MLIPVNARMIVPCHIIEALVRTMRAMLKPSGAILAEPWLGFAALAPLTSTWVEEGTSPIPPAPNFGMATCLPRTLARPLTSPILGLTKGYGLLRLISNSLKRYKSNPYTR